MSSSRFMVACVLVVGLFGGACAAEPSSSPALAFRDAPPTRSSVGLGRDAGALLEVTYAARLGSTADASSDGGALEGPALDASAERTPDASALEEASSLAIEAFDWAGFTAGLPSSFEGCSVDDAHSEFTIHNLANTSVELVSLADDCAESRYALFEPGSVEHVETSVGHRWRVQTLGGRIIADFVLDADAHYDVTIR